MGKIQVLLRIPVAGGSTLRRVHEEPCLSVIIVTWILISFVILGVTVYIGKETKLDCDILPLLLSFGAMVLLIFISALVLICCRTCCTDNGCINICSIFVILLVLGAMFATMFFAYRNFDKVSTKQHQANQQNISISVPLHSTGTADNSITMANTNTTMAYNSTINLDPDVSKSSNYCNHLLYFYIFGLVTALAVLILLCPLCCCCLCGCCIACCGGDSYDEF